MTYENIADYSMHLCSGKSGMRKRIRVEPLG